MIRPGQTIGPGQDYPNPILTVDAVLISLFGDVLKAAVMPRMAEPYAGAYALPGGYVHLDEDADTQDAMSRVLRDKLGMAPRHLEQVQTVSGPRRDPRGWSASVVYLALTEPDTLSQLEAHGKARLYEVQPQMALPKLAFDHTSIVKQAIARLRDKAGYTTIVGHFLPQKFPLVAFHRAYEAVRQQSVNLPSFRRKLLDSGALREHEGQTVSSQGRPAGLFSLRGQLAYFERDLGGK